MKKYSLLAAAAVAVIAFSSCDKKGESSMQTTTPIVTYNLFTPTSGANEAYVRLNQYAVTMKWPEQTIALAANSLALPSGANTSFSLSPLPAAQAMVIVDDRSCEVVQFGAAAPESNGARVSSLDALLMQSVYLPPLISTGGNGQAPAEGTIDFDKTFPVFVPGNSNHYAVMQYELNGNWNVRTFWPDVTFRGTTQTTYPGTGEPYRNSEIAYRVIMKLKDNLPTDKADVIFYNAKFAPPAPEITVVLKDLDLKFDANGYTITGSNVIPQMYMDRVLADNPKYKFNDFKLTVGGNLTNAYIEYTVADVFKGKFSGSYLKFPEK